jgi:2-methylcitrate dehydratase PrpD
MLQLRAQGLRAEQVEHITVYRHPTWAKYHRISEPRTFHEAQMSLPYSVALALIEGKALPEQYARVGVGDERVMMLSSKVAIETDESLSRGVSVRILATRSIGDGLIAEVDYPLGSLQRPLSNEQLAAKFTDLAAPVIGDRTAAVTTAVWNLEGLEDVKELSALLVPEASAANRVSDRRGAWMSGGAGEDTTGALARFAAELSPEDLPAGVVDHIKTCLLDTLGCALFGSTLE